MDDRYTDFNINRKQAQQICFAIIADIEDYLTTHEAEYQEYLAVEESKERGEKK